jgi:hypothetical protein
MIPTAEPELLTQSSPVQTRRASTNDGTARLQNKTPETAGKQPTFVGVVRLGETKVRLLDLLLGCVLGNFESLVELFRFRGLTATPAVHAASRTSPSSAKAAAGEVLKGDAAKHA